MRASALTHPASLLGVLAVGLGFRLLLAYVLLPDSGYWQDVALFASWAHSLIYQGPAQFYETAGFADYPPGFLLVLWLVGLAATAISPDDVFLTRMLVKLPSMLADVGVALVVYLSTRRLASERMATVGAAVYLFNPVSWWDSALWGQNDALGTLALSLAILALVARQPEIASFAAGMGVLMKPQFAVIGPLIAVVLLYRYLLRRGRAGAAGASARLGPGVMTGPSRALTSVTAGLLPICLVPVLFGQTPVDLLAHMRQQADLYPYASMSAFNPWAIFSLLVSGRAPQFTALIPWVDDRNPVLLSLSPSTIGLVLFGGVAAAALWRLWQELGTDGEEAALWACSSLLVFAFFVLATRMHERYAFPFFALALPLVVGSAGWRALYVVATLACWANVYTIYALSWAETRAYSPDPLTAALATPPGITAVSAVSALVLVGLLALSIAGRPRAGAASSSKGGADVGVIRRELFGTLEERDRRLAILHQKP